MRTTSRLKFNKFPSGKSAEHEAQRCFSLKVDGQEATFPRSQYQEATVRSSKKPVASWHWLLD